MSADLAKLEEAGEVLVPDFETGEVVDVMAHPERIPDLILSLRRAKDMAQQHVGTLTTVVELLAESRGTKTLHLGEHKVQLSGGTEIVWDVEELQKLLDLGLPEDRYAELVKTEISYKVNAAVAKQIAAANPTYAKVIERARNDFPKRPSVKVD